ncbi:MAG: MBL fold metallo-hydrolase [Deltaproteobacteria bacterium]|nr:MAG: MBL fold metallo-hydrolase [Deltaproteobacteria bacterium]RLB09814.1 MAG: MBL fold metallo-hydrolase [Deltaproteobacteria bacterium]
MKVTFWGVRGSLPAPLSNQEIREKIKTALKGARGLDLSNDQEIDNYVEELRLCNRTTVGGNTSCVEVWGKETLIILDAGSGLRNLGTSLLARNLATHDSDIHILISHTHWDHIMGFPFFAPAFIPSNRIFIYGCHSNMKERFLNLFHHHHFPINLEALRAEIKFMYFSERETIRIGEFEISSMPLHHPGISYAYRITDGKSSLVYATDGEYRDLTEDALENYLNFFRNSQLLIFDSQFTLEETMRKEGWGHSSSLVGVDFALKSNIERLALYHHEPSYDDCKLDEITQKTKRYFQLIGNGKQLDIVLAQEGLQIEI